ncbi:MAG: glycosyltransferase [Flavobacteriales bacterium]|nr:MAG: glycosyltransferase [Flavobacteriales bacterium]
MEARNFQTANEIIENDNWLLPTLNDEPRYQKPPLPTWLTALSVLLFNSKAVIFYRIPAILFLFIIGVTSYFFSIGINFNKSESIINGLITVSSIYIIAIIFEAPWDIFAHGFMFIAIYYLFNSFKNSFTKSHNILIGILIGLSIMSKGPISIYALLIPFLLSYLLVYKKISLNNLIIIFFISIVSGGIWYLYVYTQDYNTLVEIGAQETENWSNYNVKPFYYYWDFFINSGIWTIPAITSIILPFINRKISVNKHHLLICYWVLFSVILLSLIPEKKTRYLMPVLIPLALNTGFYINYIIKYSKQKISPLLLPIYLNFLVIAIFGLIIPINHILNYGISSLPIIGVLITLFFIYNFYKRNFDKVIYLKIILFFTVINFTLPQTYSNTNNDYTSLNSLENEIQNLKLYSDYKITADLIWNLKRKVKKTELSKINDSIFVLISNKNYDSINYEFRENRLIIDKKIKVDFNPTTEDSNRYRDRLATNLYILSKI